MERLAQKILDLKEFKEEYAKVVHASVLTTLPTILRRESEPDSGIDWQYLLLCASILAQSGNSACQDAALRIAQHCISSSENETYRTGAAVVFGKLTNSPAIKLAIEQDLLSPKYEKDIPPTLLIEKKWRDESHSIDVANETEILNRFQKELYVASRERNKVSASAPTSAGKSFVLGLIVAKTLSETTEPKHVVYLVPTRALINEVEDKFNGSLEKYGILASTYITSMPKIPPSKFGESNHLYVFTQERLHWFLTDNPDYRIDLLIVDEAQKIGDGQRGILLQAKVEQVQKINPDAKVLFCSAFSQNPEVLLEVGLSEVGVSILTDYVAVNQNLIWVSKVPRKPKVWEVSLCLTNNSIPLGSVEFETKLTSIKAKCSTLPFLLSKGGGNLIYASGAAAAEDIAKEIAALHKKFGVQSDSSVFDELIELSKTLIHPKYLLPDVLQYGVAFHYGNMPLLVRREIERLFREGYIKYLVCTSTLLEGVNLSAKSIFITNPSRGQGTPMTEADFWNLAGRAGRLSTDFQGNIFCIEPEEWLHKPIWGERRYRIVRSLQSITADSAAFLEFVSEHFRNPEARNQNMEYALSYYFLKFIDGEHTLLPSAEVANLLAEMKEIVSLPNEIFRRNPGVSPIAIQRLYDHFSTQDNLQELLPPESISQDDAVTIYSKILKKVNDYLVPKDMKYMSTTREALLAVFWMRGYPLPRIIANYYKWQTETGLNPKLSAVIRETMKNIEDDIRFGFAKYITCYQDVLTFFLTQSNRPDLVAKIPDIRTWIEFGVSQQTQVSFINMGFNRHVATELAKLAGNPFLDEEKAMIWLLAFDQDAFELPETFKQEIRRVKEALS